MKYTFFAWFQFIVGFIVIASVDYWIRWRDGWLGDSGMPTPDVVWFGVPMLLGLIGVVLLCISTAGIQRLWVRAAIIVAQAAIGFFLYAVACLWYVVETSVDCM